MVKVYSAAEISLIFSLIPIEGGRGDSDFVTIAKAEPTFTTKVGVDGEATRSESKNGIYSVKVSLMQTSAANAILSAIHIGDLATPGGAGIAPILIRDKQGKSLFAAAEAWITKMPDLKYAKEADVVEWEFDVNQPQHFIGGN